MLDWLIAADSSCDLPESEFGAKVPFIISVGSRDYWDTEELEVEAMLDDMDSVPEASHTSCPSPGAWLELFERAENIIAVTISGKLSGSYSSAEAARDLYMEKHPERNVLLIDSRSTGPAVSLIVERARELVDSGADFESVKASLTAYSGSIHTAFALTDFTNLIKNGRLSPVAGFVASKLGIWGVGVGTSEGRIKVGGKIRGTEKMLIRLVENMRSDGFAGGRVYISHCLNSDAAQKLFEKIKRAWPDSRVGILKTRGLCSYYAGRRGLILAY